MVRLEIKKNCDSIIEATAKYLGIDPELFSEEAYIAGGAIRSMLLYEKVKDYDIFLKTSIIIKTIREFQGEVCFISKNAVTIVVEGVQVQIITNDFGYPDKVVAMFDFTVNQNYYDPFLGVLYIGNEKDIIQRQLVINKNCRNKLGTLARITKFVNRGYKCPDKINMLMLGADISAIDKIENFDQVKEESKLYFSSAEYAQVIDREYWEIKQEDLEESKKEKKIDHSNNRGSAF